MQNKCLVPLEMQVFVSFLNAIIASMYTHIVVNYTQYLFIKFFWYNILCINTFNHIAHTYMLDLRRILSLINALCLSLKLENEERKRIY